MELFSSEALGWRLGFLGDTIYLKRSDSIIYSLWYQLIWLGKYLAELIRNFAWKEEDNWKRKNWGTVSLIRCWMKGEVIWKVTFFAGTSGDMVEVERQKHFNCNQFPLGTSQWFPLGKEWVMKAPAGISGFCFESTNSRCTLTTVPASPWHSENFTYFCTQWPKRLLSHLFTPVHGLTHPWEPPETILPEHQSNSRI